MKKTIREFESIGLVCCKRTKGSFTCSPFHVTRCRNTVKCLVPTKMNSLMKN